MDLLPLGRFEPLCAGAALLHPIPYALPAGRRSSFGGCSIPLSFYSVINYIASGEKWCRDGSMGLPAFVGDLEGITFNLCET